MIKSSKITWSNGFWKTVIIDTGFTAVIENEMPPLFSIIKEYEKRKLNVAKNIALWNFFTFKNTFEDLLDNQEYSMSNYIKNYKEVYGNDVRKEMNKLMVLLNV